jgi:hypothetical protein
MLYLRKCVGTIESDEKDELAAQVARRVYIPDGNGKGEKNGKTA